MFTSNSPGETEECGRHFAQSAGAGDVLALRGDLGAGKTQFVKGFVAGMGSPANVTSPTFTIVHEYDGGRLPVYHFDFYRLESAEAALRLGLDEYLGGEGVALIEWADRFPDVIPNNAIWIAITSKGESERLIKASRPA